MNFRNFLISKNKNVAVAALALTVATVPAIAMCGGEVSATSGKSTAYLPDGVYRLASQGGQFLTETNGNIVIQSAGQATSFKLTQDSSGYYTITSQATGRVLDVAGASKKSGANVGTWQANGSCAQKWALDIVGDSNYVLRNRCSSNALDITSGLVARAGTNVWMYKQNGSAAQVWTLQRIDGNDGISEGVYGILSGTSGMALDVQSALNINGAPLQLWSSNGSAAQRFKLTRYADGAYRIMSQLGTKSVDVRGVSRTAGAQIQLWDSSSTCAQKWFAERDGKYYVFKNSCSGNVLDVDGGQVKKAGARIQTWTKNGTAAQKWVLKK